MALSVSDRQDFLAQPHIAAMSIEAGPDRAPLSVPIWYGYTPGGRIWILTGTESRKMDLLRSAQRCTFMVERVAPSLRYVSVTATVAEVRDGTEADARELAERYLPSEAVEPYLAVALSDHGEQSRVELDPQQWVSSDLGSI